MARQLRKSARLMRPSILFSSLLIVILHYFLSLAELKNEICL